MTLPCLPIVAVVQDMNLPSGAGRMQPQFSSVFHPDTEQARAIAGLFYFDLAIAACILAIVVFLVVYVCVRFRHRPGDPEPRQDHGNAKLEVLWTVIPGLVLLALLIATGVTMHKVNPAVGQREPDVIVIAHQWWWEYHYPKSNVVTANEMHMPAGSDWLLQVRSADVIHDFWVPNLGAKTDAIPGRSNPLWIKPHHTGIYLGTCAEYCGTEHAMMGIRVVVETPNEFGQWIQSQLHVPDKPDTELAQQGARLFETRTCMNCHRIAGTEAQGKVGPDLTHVADRQTLAAGVLDNTRSNLTTWIRSPQSIKEGCHMPNVWLTEDEANAVTAYLEGLK